jgi:hypothetical protein
MAQFIVKIVASQAHAAEEGVHLEGALGMAFFAGAAGIIRNVQGVRRQEPFQQAASIFEQRLAQAQLDGFQIANALPGKALLNEPQEGPRLPELFFLDFRELEFFLTSGSPSAN